MDWRMLMPPKVAMEMAMEASDDGEEEGDVAGEGGGEVDVMTSSLGCHYCFSLNDGGGKG